MRSAERIWPVDTVQLVPSATTTTSGREPARRRAASTPRPSLIWRQPRTSTSNPAGAARCGAEHHRVADGQGRRAGAAQLGRLEVLHCRRRPPVRPAPRQPRRPPTRLASPPEVVFPSFEFALFFPVVLALSWALMPHPRAWKPVVLAASYVFYSAASPRYCILMAGLTLANQAGALPVHRTEDERAASGSSASPSAMDLGVLGVFKYYGFFVDEFGAFLDSLGLGMPLPLLTLALPIGLSFITFQAISYVVDVKRGLLPPASLLDFALYLSFFPHVVAGPIVRAREFIPQLVEAARPAGRRGRRRRRADRARPHQEGRARRLPGARDGRPRVRRAGGLRRARRGARRLRLRGPDLLRLLGLHGHRDRRRAADGLRLPAELQQPLPRHQLPRLLAALAHDAVALPARLPLHPARRQPRRQGGRRPAT